MKKKIISIFIATLSCFCLGALIETFFFNFSYFIQTSENPSQKLSFNSKTKNNTTTVSIQQENVFIKKLVIDYSTNQNTDFILNYNYIGEYNNTITDEINDKFEKKFTKTTLNINRKISKLEITYPSSSQVKIDNISIDNDFNFNTLRFLFVSLSCLILFFLFYFYKDGFRTERIHIYFATLGFLLGSLLIIAQPTSNFYSWDDQIHFERVVGFFGGTVQYTTGEYNSIDIDSAGKNSISSIEDRQIQEQYLNSNTENNNSKQFSYFTPYSKFSYLPMTLGYHGAKILGFPFTVCFIMGKLFNLLTYILLIAYAIKTLKSGKLLLAVIALLPTNLFLACSYSYDPAVFAGISIFLAHLFNLFTDKTKKLDFYTLLIMLLSITYACLAKSPYSLLLLLLLFIPKRQFSHPSRAKFIKISLVFVTILLFSFMFLPILNGTFVNDSRGGDTSAKDQIMLILEHPLDFITILKNTAGDLFFSKLLSTDTITNFAYIGSIDSSNNLYFLILIILILVAITDNANNNLSNKHRFSILSTIFSIILLIWISLYISFTPVGLNTINGVQGRYFLPLIFPIVFAIQPKKLKNNFSPQKYNAVVVSILSLAFILIVYDLILATYSF